MARAIELQLQLPDPAVLTHVLSRWSEHVGRVGGHQVAYRVASLRQILMLDQGPTLAQVSEFAEALQAEAEPLVLSMANPGGVGGTTDGGRKKENATTNAVKAAALQAGQGLRDDRAGGDPKGAGGDASTSRPKCKFWGTTVGCKHGEGCQFVHSWDGIQKRGRCWNCSAEGHMKPDCPFMKKDESEPNGDKKMAKFGSKGGSKSKDTTVEGNGKPASTEDGGKGTGGRSTTATPSTPGSGNGNPTKGVTEEVDAKALLGEVTSLMKSLRSMKALQAKYIASRGAEDNLEQGEVALLDGGATHALRKGSQAELDDAEPVQVELVCGSATLWRRKGSMTLLSKENGEPIIPLRMLVENGYMLKWSAADCEISHPDHGRIRCWRRSGCPVMNREEALKLLNQLENVEKENEILDEELNWWVERYPEVPVSAWKKMKGQGKDWRACEGSLPWNRRQRRRLESSRGVILHIFAGNTESSSRWKDLEDTGCEVLVLDVLRNSKEDIHSPAVWAYLWELATRGLIRMVYGGPPCRSTSRLRHRRPGPRPVRGRDKGRFGLENLTEAEEGMVEGDTALIFKLLGLYEKTVEVNGRPMEVGFLMEHPADPLEYMENTNGHDYPSIWEWKEIKDFVAKFGLVKISFDQGGTGHPRPKPTTGHATTRRYPGKRSVS